MDIMPRIRLRNVSRVYQTDTIETQALADIDLEIEAGEFVSIAGPSGCGKSTLLAILGLLDCPDDGDYWLDARATTGLSASERASIRNLEIGYVFQAFNLIGELSVYDNVELPLTYRGIGSTPRVEYVQRALHQVGMAHRAEHFPGQLSGGEQQRVAVARAIAGDPVLLLADEPTGNLDSRNGEAVMNLLHDLHAGGATIVMVTHDPRYADAADRNVFLLDGKLVDDPDAMHILASLGFHSNPFVPTSAFQQ